jgi:hypothetical protein
MRNKIRERTWGVDRVGKNIRENHLLRMNTD